MLPGPVATDTSLLHELATRHFVQDSLKATRLARENTSGVEFNKLIYPQSSGFHSPSTYVPSIFREHKLKPGDFGMEKPVTKSDTWTPIALLSLVVVIAVLRTRYFSKVRTLLNAFITNRFIGQLTREENVFTNRVNILLSAIYIWALSLFAFLSYKETLINFFPAYKEWEIFLFLNGFIVFLYLIKILVIRLFGFLFEMQRQATEYIFGIFLYNQMAGIFLLPLLLGMIYITIINTNTLTIIGLCGLGFFYLLRLTRVVFTAAGTPGISLYYLFLYLCTLEFLPLLIVIKFITL